jgi:hypothetical protein
MHTGRQLTEALNKVSAPSLFGVFYRSISEAAIHSLKATRASLQSGRQTKGAALHAEKWAIMPLSF